MYKSDYLLKINGLQKKIGKKQIISGFSCEIDRGEIIGLLGPNGAGKTTCFQMIVGLQKPDKGSISFMSNDITELSISDRSNIGITYLPQEPSIFRGLNVEQNIMAILEIREPSANNRESRLEELLVEFRITHLRYASSPNLSGGERRRVEIARALATDPKVILLDEPFAGVDPIAIKDMGDLLLTLKNKGISVLLTDHNVKHTLDVVDKVVIINKGKVIAEGSTSFIVNNPEVRKLYLGEEFRY